MPRPAGSPAGFFQKDVDAEQTNPHNLIPLLLTNKTIRKRSKAVPNTKFFNNKQSISVGV